jgi:hypothetical protein
LEDGVLKMVGSENLVDALLKRPFWKRVQFESALRVALKVAQIKFIHQ